MALDAILIAQINANTQAINKLNEDARKTSELPLMPVLDVNSLIRVEFGGISKHVKASQFAPPNAEFLEYIFNKQNDLSPDGTGIKYPTVDAVIDGLLLQKEYTDTLVADLVKVDKTNFKDIYQTGILRIDLDVSVLTVSPADTLTITACNNLLFVNEIAPDTPANLIGDYLKSFGNKSFVANGTNTPLTAGTRGIFYVGLDKLGNQVYRTAKVYDQDIAYLARMVVENNGGVYTIVLNRYMPDLANNRVNNRDRFVIASGSLVPSGASSISFGNRGMSFYKNSINYATNKFDPNYLALADSVNPTPAQFLFYLPNITNLAVSLATSTTINPTQWYTAGGALGGTAVNGTNYQVYKVYLSVTGTIIIQTKASTSNAPEAGVNAIFANRESALAGLTSTVFPQLTPVGDYIALGTFFLRAGTAVNGSQMNDPNDFYFQAFTTSSSSSSVGVTEHDLLSGKNTNPAFQHVTSAEKVDWNTAFADRYKWDGSASGLDALLGRTSLGGTTIGQNLFTSPNPSAVRFLRANADNSISWLDANTFRTAIGAGTGNGTGNGSVTSVDMIVPVGLTIAGNPITGAGTLNLAYQAGYSIPTDAKQAQWDSAYANDANLLHKTGNETKTGVLTLNPSVPASGGLARGMFLRPTETATANNDVLVGLDVDPIFTNGAFTGVTNLGIRSFGIIRSQIPTGGILDLIGVGSGGGSINAPGGGSITLQSSSVTGIQLTGGTRNVIMQNGGTYTDNGVDRLQVTGSGRFSSGLVYTRGISISSQDLDAFTDAGFYIGSSLTNAPDTGWFYVTIERFTDTNWVHQTLTSLGTSGTSNRIYSRTRVNGVWSAWAQIFKNGDPVLLVNTTDNGVDKLQVGGSIKAERITTNIFNFLSDNVKTSPATVGKFSTFTQGGTDFELIFNRSASGASGYYAIQSVEQATGYRNLVLNPSGGHVGLGTFNPLTIIHGAIGFPKTDTTLRTGFRLSSNDVSNPAGVNISLIGGASQAVRTVSIQSDEFGVVSGGNIALQASGGNVLVGTTTGSGVANERLQVNGDVRISSSLRLRNGIWLMPDGVDRALFRAEAGNGDLSIFQYDSGGTFLRQALSINNNTGNISIGSVNPISKFEVIRTGAGILDTMALINNNQTVGVVDGVRLKLRDFTIESSSTYGSSDNILTIGINTNKQITLLQNGNVGISTTTPSHILHLKQANPIINLEKAGILNWQIGNYSGNDFRIRCDSGDTNFSIAYSTGNVTIGAITNNGIDRLQVGGSGLFTGGIISDTHSIFRGGTGNSYSNGAIETRGSGAGDSVFPSIGFHQPSLYGFSLQARGQGFFFMDIDGTNRANVYVQALEALGNINAGGIVTFPSLGNGSATQYVTVSPSGTLGGAILPKKYIVQLQQNGSGAPAVVATVVSTLSDTPVISYIGTGQYRIASADFSNGSKMNIRLNQGVSVAEGSVRARKGSGAWIDLNTYNTSQLLSNDVISIQYCTIDVEIYP